MGDFPIHEDLHVLVIQKGFGVLTRYVLDQKTLLSNIWTAPLWRVGGQGDFSAESDFEILLLIGRFDSHFDPLLYNLLLFLLHRDILFQKV